MSNNKVPRVDISEVVSQLAVPRQNNVIIGVIGASKLATNNGVQTSQDKVYRLNSVSQAEAYFGSDDSLGRNLLKLVKNAFDGGAAEVHAASIGDVTVGNYSLLASGVVQGNNQVVVISGGQLSVGNQVYLGTNSAYRYEEFRTVSTIVGNLVTLDRALDFTHYANETLQAVTPKASSAYQASIDAVEADPEKSLVVCEDNSDAVAALMEQMATASATQDSPCVYIRGFDYSVSESSARTKATATNDERVINLWPTLKNFDGKIVTGGEVAAAVAGAIAGNGVPKLNHNFTQLTNFGGVAATITDYDALILAGVAPIELKYNQIRLVRFITTWVTLNGVTDTTWQEAAVRLNVDAIERNIKQRLTLKFLQSGNTPNTREAIKQEVITALKQFAAQEILVADTVFNTPAFKDPVVAESPYDATQVDVDVEISPGRPLNFIKLNFKIFL